MSLEAQALVKYYNGRPAVDGVSLSVERGEVVGLLGPNGAGKTTTFSLIVGFLRPQGGSIYLNKSDITNLPMHERARLGIGYLPQEPSIFRHLTVAHNIMAVLQLKPGPRVERKQRLEELLKSFHLTHARNQMARTLSGGERRRVELARALALEPSFLLLDEPFTGVDPIAVSELQDSIGRLRSQGLGLLLTDHNVREALAITDRNYIIHEGRVLVEGPSSELPNDPIARKFYLGERFAV